MTRPALLAAAALCVAAASALSGEIAPDQLADLPPTDVVVIGERHGNPAHHANQATVVAALAPATIVFEMLTPDHAATITPALRDDAAALAEAVDWTARGWPDFELYYPIFTAASDAAIAGGDLPRDVVRRALSEGARAVLADIFDTETAARYGLDRPLAAGEQAARETLQARAHCDALPEDMLPGMVAAQRLRDAALAHAVAKAAQGGRVVLITGNGHARTDWGVPAMLAEAAPELSVLSIGQFEAPPDATPPHDRWLVTDAPEREDPCAAFD